MSQVAHADQVKRLAELFRQRNVVDAEIARLINRPAEKGHIGEWLAAAIFDIELKASATHRSVDGHFRSGVLAGRSVNIKFYGKQESILDMARSHHPDHYLVLTGAKGAAHSSVGRTRPLTVEHVYLFDGEQLHCAISGRGCKIGVATSVARRYWDEAEVYPRSNCASWTLADDQRAMLAQFREAGGQTGLP